VEIADGQRFGLYNLRPSLSNWLVNKAKVEPKTVQGILRYAKIQTILALCTQEDSHETRAAQGEFLKAVADMLEPINTLLEVGMASIRSFRTIASAQDAEGNFIAEWEAVFGGTYATGKAIRWRTVRAWKSRRVIAERIESLPSSEPAVGR
jgi:hypothetical protein